MLLNKLIAINLLVLPCVANAFTAGSWSKDSAGGILGVGNQIMTSQRLAAPADLPKNATVVSISWKITLLSPPPPGLQIKLCHAGGCSQLTGLSGQFTPVGQWPASSDYQFIYSVQSVGQLRPALNVVKNYLTINYLVN